MKRKKVNYSKKLNSLKRLDMIRVMKLLEFAQYAILATAAALITGPILNKSLFAAPHNKKSTSTLLTEIFIEVGIIGVVIYYIKKIIHIIPFFFQSLYHKYIPSYHNEAMIGIAIGIDLVFNHTQTNLIEKINIVTQRYLRYL